MPNLGHNIRGLNERSGCRAAPTMTTLCSEKFLFVKRSQPIEEHCPKKRLAKSATSSASNTIPFAVSKPTSAGSNATSTFAASAIRPKWVPPK